jgi:hypothetical protein
MSLPRCLSRVPWATTTSQATAVTLNCHRTVVVAHFTVSSPPAFVADGDGFLPGTGRAGNEMWRVSARSERVVRHEPKRIDRCKVVHRLGGGRDPIPN